MAASVSDDGEEHVVEAAKTLAVYERYEEDVPLVAGVPQSLDAARLVAGRATILSKLRFDDDGRIVPVGQCEVGCLLEAGDGVVKNRLK